MPRRSRAEADRLVSEYEASGLSRREFCKQRSLSLNTLNRYCGRRRASAEAGGGNWLEVELRAAGTGANSDSGVCLQVAGNRRIEIARSFDADTLERVVRLLERL